MLLKVLKNTLIQLVPDFRVHQDLSPCHARAKKPLGLFRSDKWPVGKSNYQDGFDKTKHLGRSAPNPEMG